MSRLNKIIGTLISLKPSSVTLRVIDLSLKLSQCKVVLRITFRIVTNRLMECVIASDGFGDIPLSIFFFLNIYIYIYKKKREKLD